MSHLQNKYAPLTHLGDIPVATFFKEYWQKKPLLIRNAFPSFESPVTPDELAGLALEEDVTSRLVLEYGLNGQTPWEVIHGPLEENLFSQLPESHWTMLIQHADLLHPDITSLLNAFRFIPSWRLDDIMISYAADQGTVGPHFDYYDVLLLQAEGKRRWQLGQICDTKSPLIEGVPMQILQKFDQTQEWLVEPGDLLYLPPGLAHWGVAQGECMTYSVGFRAPSQSDIFLDFFTERSALSTEDDRYQDPDLAVQEHSGEITADAVKKIREALLNQCTVENLLDWFGAYMTQPNPGGESFAPDPTHPDEIESPVQIAPQLRCAYFSRGARADLFINGEQLACSKTLAISLSEYQPINIAQVSEQDRKTLLKLASLGFLTNVK